MGGVNADGIATAICVLAAYGIFTYHYYILSPTELEMAPTMSEFHIIFHLLSWDSGAEAMMSLSHVHNMSVSHS